MEVRELNATQLRIIYLDYMIYDFSKYELKNLKQLVYSYKHKDMVILSLYDKQLIGYDLIFKNDNGYLYKLMQKTHKSLAWG